MSRGETLPLLWVGDKLVSADEARIDPRDRGYTLGDGLFETMLSRQGRVPLLGEHLSRLRIAFMSWATSVIEELSTGGRTLRSK